MIYLDEACAGHVDLLEQVSGEETPTSVILKQQKNGKNESK
jgi:hypothetical protein